MKRIIIVKINVHLFFFVFFYNLMINYSYAGGNDFFSDDMMGYDFLEIQNSRQMSANPRISPALLEIIKSRPLFVESRRSARQSAASQTSTLLIDNDYKEVELVGTIESTNVRVAAFTLGSEDSVWLQLNDYLGDWRIEDITSSRVRLKKEALTRILQIRENAD